jgi:hypothetical protein
MDDAARVATERRDVERPTVREFAASAPRMGALTAARNACIAREE